MEEVVRIEHLRKNYGETLAVDDISFAVRQGEIFGIVGPNGAGKTTAVECMTGLRKPDGGAVEVLGMDSWREKRKLTSRIGIQLQQAALPERIKVWEALDLYASFYEHPADWRELLDHWGLSEKRNTVFDSLSGGQKQRLFIALALLGDPEVVFLDEITSGLDPQARRASWDLVRGVRDAGRTVVLVTHFMDEAERLCDRVAFVDRGRIVALDSPQALIHNLNAESSLSFTAANSFDLETLRKIPKIHRVERDGSRIIVHGSGSLLAPVAAELVKQGLNPTDLETEQTTLEDVFLALTGHEIKD